ncbi:hypothetical protein RA27_20915 [Ruegeria sp. ANG-R]|uniref:hypothetical protein n=1 Tax=Ruegeria sp. ANG-R TaxID=1577903 RepID=UPI00057FC438|nr:hypothetical protein [Ruegeria sp. ANG-R]KIC38229.1 hypothetical protein RA27_20915 [Ruegeria sp. ANG-R]
MKKLVVLGMAIALAGCEGGNTLYPEPDVIVDPAPLPTTDNLNLVRGYRSADDWCQVTGETAFTAEFLDHTADLVSCPTGSNAAQSLVDTYGARQVAETGGYTVYSIQRE